MVNARVVEDLPEEPGQHGAIAELGKDGEQPDFQRSAQRLQRGGILEPFGDRKLRAVVDRDHPGEHAVVDCYEVTIAMVKAVDEPAIGAGGMLANLFSKNPMIETMNLFDFFRCLGLFEENFRHEMISLSEVKPMYHERRWSDLPGTIPWWGKLSDSRQ